jgi:hypothetical protein
MASIANGDLGFDPNEYDTDPVQIAYRDALADGLERVLDQGVENLADIVQALNALSVSGPNGRSWTTDTLEAQLCRLGK